MVDGPGFAIAWSKNATGTIAGDSLGYFNWTGTASPSIINWFPELKPGTYTGQGQAGWNVTGNSQYVVIGGEFPTVNGVGQQGLVRFAVKPIAPSKLGPRSDRLGLHAEPGLAGRRHRPRRLPDQLGPDDQT